MLKGIEALVGRTFTMVELDNEMENLGYYSEGDAIDDIEVIENGCICYTKDGENYDTIDFEVVRDITEEESTDCTVVKVTVIR